MGHRSTVTFFLNDVKHNIQPASPTQTLLQYLREQVHLIGAKEGCAEGDCGACAVTEASLDAAGELHYRVINACIRFLPTIDGKSIRTVEGLSRNGDDLHPVQQALIDHHGSQCGYCTPGFVMSMYTLYIQRIRQPTREQVLDQLSGNLCRCTGYRSIIDAALRMHDYPEAGIDDSNVRTQLQELTTEVTTPFSFSTAEQSYYAPRTLEQLADQVVQYPDAVLLAGGTDVGLWVTKQLRTLTDLIYLGDIPEFCVVKREGSWIRIGAAVLLEDAYREITLDYPELVELWKRFASLPIRSSGTLVGNLANGSPIGDTAPILIALGARVVLRLGSRQRELDLEDLYVEYGKQAREKGEFIEAVLIPQRDSNVLVASYKVSKRFDQDISAVCSGYAITLDDGMVTSVRIAHGGMAATTRRAFRTEAALLGLPWLEPAVREAMQAMSDDYQPLTDMRASDGYRLKVAQNLLYRFYLETGTDTPTRVHAGGRYAIP